MAVVSIVQDITIRINHAVLTVTGVRIKRNISQDAELRAGRFQGTNGTRGIKPFGFVASDAIFRF